MGKRFNFPFDNGDEEDFGKEPQKKKKEKDESTLEDQIILAQQEQTDILRIDIDEKILHDAILVAGRDWLWCFRPAKSKLAIIKKIYTNLKKMIDDLF